MSDTPFQPTTSGTRRRWLALLAGGGLIAAAVIAYLLGRPAAPATDAGADHQHGATGADSLQAVMLPPGAAERIGITFATATVGPMEREIRTVAQVSYDETRIATVALKIEGWVERLYVNIEGQPVQRGEPLLDLYSPMLVSAQQELLVARRLASEMDSGAPAARANAAELLDAARRRLTYWDVPDAVIADIEHSGEVRKAVPFLSPVGGVVVQRNVLAGQRVMAGDPLYRIADLSHVWLEGEVFEPDLPLAQPGLPVTAEFPGLPGATRHGRISYVYPALDPATRTGRIRVELDNPGRLLKPGMYATIRFTAPARTVLSVPRSAVLATGERTFVFVAGADGMFTPRQVTTGLATDDRIAILDGLSPGENVVASGTFLLDAESNLGTAMGGMGNMPGMDMTAPSRESAPAPAPMQMPMPVPAQGGQDAHANH